MMTTDKQNQHPALALKTLPVQFVLPVALTIALFILTIYLVMIPQLEKSMMSTKREGLKRLTEGAWSTLDIFHKKALQGVLTDEQAKEAAIAHFGQLRYGPEQVDYFWINDMIPVMIMHPYRPDLVGTDVSGFKDPSGKLLFVEMVKTVEQKDAGFVEYLWQRQDDPENLVPKISFVKAFAPWGWVIGTGIYVEDVKQEIRAVTRHVTLVCLGILILFIILSGYMVWQGAKAKKDQIFAMDQARIKEKQLIQADKMTSLGILVSGVAHEVNNPVTSIMLNAPNLKKAWQSFTPILEDHFRDRPEAQVCNMPYTELAGRIFMMITAIEESAARIKKIITELKDFSRPGGGGMDRPVDINLMVGKAIDLTRSLLKKSTRHFSARLDENLPMIRANEQKLQQVIINLIVNACQALENQDQSITVSTLFLPESGTIRIRVEDTGSGIAIEDLARIKEPFFTTKRDDGGTGLGLSICEKIANDHRGTLDFESTPGQGVTATLDLPVMHPDEKKVLEP